MTILKECMLIASCAATLLAQEPRPPAFEVASIKPTSHGRDANGFSRSDADFPSPGRFVATNSSLDELIRTAYQVKEYQVSGPAWLDDDEESFDIEAKAAPGTPKAQMRLMLQSLLAERFKLAVHKETRTLPVYRLIQAKGGTRLTPAPEGSKGFSTSSGGGRMEAKNVSMADFAYQLARHLNRQVTDETGIPGKFNLTLRFDDREAGERPDLFTAIQQQLGLKLEAGKAPVEVLVIDHIEKAPTEN